MKKKFLVIPFAFIFLLMGTALNLGESGLPSKKQTALGLHVTAKQAFAQWHATTEEVAILDVRTPE